MNIKVLILITAIFTSSYIQAQWQVQVSGTTENLYNSFFINQNTGWIVGANGKILFTSNGGTTWGTQTSGTTQTLFNVDFPSAMNGFIIGSLNTFLRTTNGGLNWTSLGVPNMTSTNDIDFIDNNTGFACGADGDVARTTNAGTNWTKFDIPGASDMFRIKTFDANTAITGGVGGTTYKTTNGGVNWTAQITGTNNFISSIAFTDNNNGYITTLGITEDVRRTTNGGLNWVAATSPGNTSGLNDLAMINPNTVYGVGPDGVIRYTNNSGANWVTMPSGNDTSYLRGITMVDAGVGYIVGNAGRILKTVNGGIGIQQISANVPDGFALEQNYPNPFNPITNIEFSVPKSGSVKLTVFDISGREIAKLVDGNLSIGTYKVDFDAATLASGLYFYKLETEKFTETKKMILVK